MLEISFNPFPVIETQRLTLRNFNKLDAETMLEMRSNVEMMKYICRPVLNTIEESEALIQRYENAINDNIGINWAVFLKSENKIIGNVAFHKIDKENYRAEIGYYIHPNYWKKGFVTEAIEAIIKYGFEVYKFHSIEALIDPRNEASKQVLNKFNFVEEGLVKENFYFEGEFLDTGIYSLLKSNYSL